MLWNNLFQTNDMSVFISRSESCDRNLEYSSHEMLSSHLQCPATYCWSWSSTSLNSWHRSFQFRCKLSRYNSDFTSGGYMIMRGADSMLNMQRVKELHLLDIPAKQENLMICICKNCNSIIFRLLDTTPSKTDVLYVIHLANSYTSSHHNQQFSKGITLEWVIFKFHHTIIGSSQTTPPNNRQLSNFTPP